MVKILALPRCFVSTRSFQLLLYIIQNKKLKKNYQRFTCQRYFKLRPKHWFTLTIRVYYMKWAEHMGVIFLEDRGRNIEDHQTCCHCKYKYSLSKEQHFDSTLPPKTHNTHTHKKYKKLSQYLFSMSKYVFILYV